MAAAISHPLRFEPTPGTLAAALAELEELGPSGGGAVAPAAREAALQTFAAFPRDRKPTRNWRYRYAALAYDGLTWSTGRVVPPTRRGPRVSRADDAPAPDAPALAVENAGGLVHAGSVFLDAEAPSSERRFILAPLADAKRAMPARVAALHQRIVVPHADRFAALATAFQNCGAYVEIADGVRLEAPLQLLWTARPGAANAVFPHTVVRVGAGACATIVERHIGGGEALLAGIVEVDLAAGARLDYVVVQQTGDGARLFFRRQARCAPGASMGWHLAEHGGGLVRSVVRTALLGQRARVEANALFFARGFEHVDFALDVDHAAAGTDSQAVVRSAHLGRAQSRFRGTICVRPEAPFGTASLAFDALALSGRTDVVAASPLTVTASGVAVSNTAKVGSLARDELFYVQSRGISRRNAEQMMALAFYEPAIRRFPSEALRDEVRAALDTQLDDVPDTFAS